MPETKRREGKQLDRCGVFREQAESDERAGQNPWAKSALILRPQKATAAQLQKKT